MIEQPYNTMAYRCSQLKRMHIARVRSIPEANTEICYRVPSSADSGIISARPTVIEIQKKLKPSSAC